MTSNPATVELRRGSSRFGGVNISTLNSNIEGVERVRWAPGWAILRPKATDLDNLPQLWDEIDRLHTSEKDGGLNLGNTLWPSAEIVFHPNFTTFASQLKARSFPIGSMGGFCQSGSDQVDLNNNDDFHSGGSRNDAIGYWGKASYNGPGAHSYLEEGAAILGSLMGGCVVNNGRVTRRACV